MKKEFTMKIFASMFASLLSLCFLAHAAAEHGKHARFLKTLENHKVSAPNRGQRNLQEPECDPSACDCKGFDETMGTGVHECTAEHEDGDPNTGSCVRLWVAFNTYV